MGDQEEEENAAEGKFGRVFEKARALSNIEASSMLHKLVAAKRDMDPAYQPNPLLAKAMDYVDLFSSNKNEAAMQQIRTLLSDADMSDFEIASIANLQPETTEEAKILIPSLDAIVGDQHRFSEEELQTLLDDVATFKQA